MQCSIDSLLDRTIKHMQFLAHVTDQADKIGKHVVKKVNSIAILWNSFVFGLSVTKTFSVGWYPFC